jgi:hypothetical protein
MPFSAKVELLITSGTNFVPPFIIAEFFSNYSRDDCLQGPYKQKVSYELLFPQRKSMNIQAQPHFGKMSVVV